MSDDINVQSFSGKVNISNNLKVGAGHLFVDTINNMVGLNTSTPESNLHVNGNVHVETDISLGGILSGNGSGLTNVNSDSGSWINGANSNIHLAVSTDKVGIGLTSPDEKLDIDGGNIRLRSTGTAKIFNHSVGSDYGNLQISSGYQNAATAPKIDLIGWTGAGTVDGDNLIKFSTNNSVRMCINQSGNVGCGTSSPQQNLHVHESGSGQVVIAVTNDTTGSGNNDGIHFGIDSSEQGFVWHKQNTALLFATNNTERMRLTNDGKLGIGTTTPHGVLDVRGAVTITTPTHDSVATKNGYLAAGSLNIGSVAANFGGGQGWTGNTAGLMLECADNTEIAVHDSGNRVASFMYFQGGNTNMFTIGRNMGWGTTKTEFGESGKRNLFYAPTNWSYSTSSTGGTILWSFTYNFPYDGYCIFNTNGHFHNSVGNQWVYAKVVINSAGTANTSGYYDSYTRGGAGDHGGDFHAYKDTSVNWQDFNWGGTLKVSAGNRTIGLHVKVSGGTVSINGAAINMFYIPTKIF